MSTAAMGIEETLGDPPPKTSPSWVEVAQMKGLRKYDVEVSDLNGHKSVEVPSEITENSSPLGRFHSGEFSRHSTTRS